MSTTSDRPAETATTEHLRLLLSNQIDAWGALFADDAVFTFPFAPDEMPTELHGIEAIKDHMRGFATTFTATAEKVHFIPTADAHLAVAQFEVNGIAEPTGKPYEQRCITVARVDDDGLITRFEDYWNPLAAIKALSTDDGAAAGEAPGAPAT